MLYVWSEAKLSIEKKGSSLLTSFIRRLVKKAIMMVSVNNVETMPTPVVYLAFFLKVRATPA